MAWWHAAQQLDLPLTLTEFVNPVKATSQPWALHWAGGPGVGGEKIQEFLSRKIYLLFSIRKENVFSEVLCDRQMWGMTPPEHHEAWRGWRERSMTQTGCSIAKLGASTPLSSQLQLQMLLCLLSFNKIFYWQSPTKVQTPSKYTVHQPPPQCSLSTEFKYVPFEWPAIRHLVM